VFDDTSPWGAWRPAGHVALLLRLTHRTPRWLSPLVRLLRRPVKYGVHHPLDVVIWGRKLRLMPRGNMSEQKLLFAPRSFDPDELAVLAEQLRPGDCFVDIGANAGAYSLWADRCMEGKGRILAVEPDPEMRRRLAFNLATNGIRGVEICPVALSDRAGSAELHVNPAQRGQNTLEAEEARSAGGRREGLSVDVETLVDLLSRRGAAGIRALKIDVEGHELTILRHFFDHAPESLRPGVIIAEAKASAAPAMESLLVNNAYHRLLATRLNVVYLAGESR
jgi:FkbM family methyltransferase